MSDNDNAVAAEAPSLPPGQPVIFIPLEKLHEPYYNYNKHGEKQLYELSQSLRVFGQRRTISVWPWAEKDENGNPVGYDVLAGNGVRKAAEIAGLAGLDCTVAPGWWDEATRKAFVVADNNKNSDPDLVQLAEIVSEVRNLGNIPLEAMGFDEDSFADLMEGLAQDFDPGEGEGVDEEGEAQGDQVEGGEYDNRPTLAQRFVVPPFSVLDARQGYWQDRKRAWIALGIKSELGRGENLIPYPKQLNADGLNYYRNLNQTQGENEAGEEDTQGEALLYTSKNLRANNGHYYRKKNKGEADEDFGQPKSKNGILFNGQDRLNAIMGQRKKNQGEQGEGETQGEGMTGTSIFDPVLTELAYTWFSPAGGTILDPFAGGSVRGIVASYLGRQYTGVDLRAEQVEANKLQWEEISKRIAQGETYEGIEDFTPDFTPVEQRGDYWFKRDDLYTIAGVSGGKVRTCWALAQGAPGLTTAGSRQSPQVNIVAHIAQRLNVPCRVHTPTGELSPEVKQAQDCGAEVIQHVAGYNSVIIARARNDAKERGWVEIPFGMECEEAVKQTRAQVANLPAEIKRIVMPVGSGMSLSGVLHGLKDTGRNIPVLGVVVGANPTERLDEYAPEGWREMVTLVDSGIDYHDPAPTQVLEGIRLDPIYEGKCVPFLEPGDLFWLVGIRATAKPRKRKVTAQRGKIRWSISAAWASKQIDCTVEGITNRCHGKCCYGPSFWPGRATPQGSGIAPDACKHLGDSGCTLAPEDKPITCHLFPLKMNKTNTKLVLWNRAAQPNSCCNPNYGKGPLVIEAVKNSLANLLGSDIAEYIVSEVKAGRDPEFDVPEDVAAALAWEETWAEKNIIPLPRSEEVARWRAQAQAQETETLVTLAENHPAPNWLVGDSMDIAQLAQGEYDFLFSCPPYADLEVYSDDPRDISNMDYENFLANYRDIIARAAGLLKDNRFACFVVGDIRHPATGIYRNFVADTIKAFQDAGLKYYNEGILVTVAGSLPIRAGKIFESSRKLGKTHQNVLVFVKGDPRKATEACGKVEPFNPADFGYNEDSEAGENVPD